MVGQRAGLGQKVFKRRALDLFHLALTAVAGIEVILEERSKINFLKRIFLIGCRGGRFFGGGAFALFFTPAYVIDERNRIFQFLEYRVLNHLFIDHVLELEFVERKHTDHLHQARGKDLAL